MRALLLVLLALALPGAATAHSSSNAYLTLAAEGGTVQVQWELALRDLDDAIGVDPDGTGIVTWAGLRQRQAAIQAYAFDRLALAGDGAACSFGPATMLADQLGDGGYAVLRFAAHCPGTPRHLSLRYTALFDIDLQHRGLVNVIAGGLSRPAVMSPAAETQSFDLSADLGATFAAFFRSGIDHILGGWDHLLFVAMLVVPAAFGRRGGSSLQEDWRSLRDTALILTAFTIAHAVSLSSVALGVVGVPTRLIEGAIALTIVATAVDNIVPFLGERRWPVAFGFGLIHGLGFAGSLGPLALPPLGFGLALAGFNLGVEAAQLSAVLVVLPLGILARRFRVPTGRVVPMASGAAALVAGIWFVGRTLGPGFGLF